jgi:hypothetical protein
MDILEWLNNLSLLPAFRHFYMWQSVGRSSQLVTKPVTTRLPHPLSPTGGRMYLKMQHLHQTVPKTLPPYKTGLNWRGEAGHFTEGYLQTKSVGDILPSPARHHLATTYLSHLHTITDFYYTGSLSLPTHTPHCAWIKWLPIATYCT